MNLDFLKLKINNELDFSNEVKKGISEFYLLNKDKFSATYEINKNNFIFNLFDNLEKSNFLIKVRLILIHFIQN